jgi:hypothetical protein
MHYCLPICYFLILFYKYEAELAEIMAVNTLKSDTAGLQDSQFICFIKYCFWIKLKILDFA